jgi:23S rRNA (cytidine1920-2'-O)/16S rRNA (cytidine1409-2'-O)-methyltransferase
LQLKKRIDRLLVERGLAETREKAQALIMAGRVLVDEQPASKPGAAVGESASIRLKPGASQYVSRGGAKLEGAMRVFGLAVEGRTCLDIGCSTGGFTQFLLRSGARKVYALDVDVRQLDWRLQQEPRVQTVVLNARFLEVSHIGEPVDLVTIDVSFISLALILPRIPAVLKSQGHCVALVKPQFEVFEVGRERVGKGGIVTDPSDQKQAVEKCSRAGEAAGLRLVATAESPIRGREGNREFFILFTKP